MILYSLSEYNSISWLCSIKFFLEFKMSANLTLRLFSIPVCPENSQAQGDAPDTILPSEKHELESVKKWKITFSLCWLKTVGTQLQAEFKFHLLKEKCLSYHTLISERLSPNIQWWNIFVHKESFPLFRFVFAMIKYWKLRGCPSIE